MKTVFISCEKGITLYQVSEQVFALLNMCPATTRTKELMEQLHRGENPPVFKSNEEIEKQCGPSHAFDFQGWESFSIIGIVTRKEAVRNRLGRYYTGRPCKRGHIAERATSNRTCLQCRRKGPRND